MQNFGHKKAKKTKKYRLTLMGKSGTPPCLTHIESLSCFAGINHKQALCNDLYYYYICFTESKTLFSLFFKPWCTHKMKDNEDIIDANIMIDSSSFTSSKYLIGTGNAIKKIKKIVQCLNMLQKKHLKCCMKWVEIQRKRRIKKEKRFLLMQIISCLINK